MEKLNLTQQKHTFTNQNKCTTTENKCKKLKPGLVASYNIRPGKSVSLNTSITHCHCTPVSETSLKKFNVASYYTAKCADISLK